MNSNARLLKRSALAVAAIALGVAAATTPATAQAEHCADLYNRVMATYQTAPFSPEYSRISSYYTSRCLSGSYASPVAGVAPYQAPYEEQPPTIISGEIVVGGVRQNDDGDHRGDDRRFR